MLTSSEFRSSLTKIGLYTTWSPRRLCLDACAHTPARMCTRTHAWTHTHVHTPHTRIHTHSHMYARHMLACSLAHKHVRVNIRTCTNSLHITLACTHAHSRGTGTELYGVQQWLARVHWPAKEGPAWAEWAEAATQWRATAEQDKAGGKAAAQNPINGRRNPHSKQVQGDPATVCRRQWPGRCVFAFSMLYWQQLACWFCA